MIIDILLNVELSREERFREFCRYIWDNYCIMDKEVEEILQSAYECPEWYYISRRFPILGNPVFSEKFNIKTYDDIHLMSVIEFKDNYYDKIKLYEIQLLNFIKDNITGEKLGESDLNSYFSLRRRDNFVFRIYDINILQHIFEKDINECYYYVGSDNRISKLVINEAYKYNRLL